jgi:hypothetical protein
MAEKYVTLSAFLSLLIPSPGCAIFSVAVQHTLSHDQLFLLGHSTFRYHAVPVHFTVAISKMVQANSTFGAYLILHIKECQA